MPNNEFVNLKNSLKFGETFCVLPFIHYYVDVDKKRGVCCLSDSKISEDDLSDIRDRLLQGLPVKECESCYKQEQNKLISGRQRAIKNHLRDEDKVIDAIEMHQLGQSPTILSYDLRYSNLCNLECQMCNPKYSSSIAEAQGIKNEFLNSEMDITINKEATDIYLAGGEPFLIKSFSRLLNSVTNKECEIVINTNCTILTDHLLTALDKFSNVSFIISIDGYGKLNETIRKNSKWEELTNNLDILATRYNGYGGFLINTVVQRDNINDLLELGSWLESKGITKWRLSLLNQPEELCYTKNSKIEIPDELMSLPLVNTNIENLLVLKNIKAYAETA